VRSRNVSSESSPRDSEGDNIFHRLPARSNPVIRPVPLHETAHAGLDGRVGPETHLVHELLHVGEGLFHVAGLHGHGLYEGLAAEGLFQGVDEVPQLHWPAVADVVQAVRRPAEGGVGVHRIPVRIGHGYVRQQAEHPLHYVVDVGEVAHHAALVEELDRFAAQDGPGEQEEGHVGPSPGAVDREKAQSGHRKLEEVGIAVRHQLVGLFGGCIERHRMVDVAPDGEGHVFISAVDRAGGGVEEVPDAVVPAALEDVEEALDVALGVGAGIHQRIAHAGLRRQVHHEFEGPLVEHFLHGQAVFDGGLHEPEVPVVRQPGQPGFLEAHVVIVVEVVEARHLPAFLKAAERHVIADESGRAGYEYFGHAIGDLSGIKVTEYR
jgi:hypothetical protein